MFGMHFGSRWYSLARNSLHLKYILAIFYKDCTKDITKVDVFISLPSSLKGIKLTTVGKTRNNKNVF